MDLYYIDYVAVSGRSWLHRLPAGVKLVTMVLVIALVLAIPRWPVASVVLGVMLLLAISARLPLRTLAVLLGYPLIFLVILAFSIKHVTVYAILPLAVRMLAITASVVLVVLTTSYPAIFGALGRIIPGGLVTALFFTYRSLFILSTSITNVRTALHLRGGMEWRHPLAALKNLGAALAHVLVHAIELSQRMADNLTIRGFNNRIYYLGRKS